MRAAGLVALAGGSLLAVLAAARWLGGGPGEPDDVGRVEIRDVLVARDSQIHQGALERCNASSCELGQREHPREGLLFIGLGVETPTLPPVEDPTRDELHLRDGSVVHEPLVQIDADRVFAGARHIERRQVAWVYLAPKPEREGPQAGEEAPFESEPEAPQEPPPPPPPPPDPEPEMEPPPPRREPNPAPLQPCPDDRPLGGEIEYDYTVKDRDYQRCSGTARLWFRLHPIVMEWPSALGVVWNSDAITYRLVNHGCTDVPDAHGMVCSAPAQPEIRGTVVLGEVGQFGVNLIGAPGGPVSFTPMAPELSFLTLPDEIRHRARTPLNCVEPHGSSSGSWEFPVIGSISPFGTGDCSSASAGVCVTPTVCVHGDPDQVAECHLHPDLYAVIPFAGSKRLAWNEVGVETVHSFRWGVCCGCGEPPSGPPPDFAPRPANDPCEDAAATLAGLVGRLRGLAVAFRMHEDAFRCAEAGREDARDRVWGLDGSLTAYFASLPWVATGSVSRAPQGGKGRAAGLDDARRLVADIVEIVQDIREGTRSILDIYQLLIDGAGITEGWKRAEDPLRGEYSRAAAAANAKAKQYLARNPGDLLTAREIFDEEWTARVKRISPRRGLNLLGALRNLSAWGAIWEATKRLVHDISLYFDWKVEEDRARRDMEGAQDDMGDVQAEIDLLRARCPDLPPGSGVPLPEPLPGDCPDVPPGSEDLRTDAAREAAAAAQRAIPGAPGTSGVLDGADLDAPPMPQGSGATGAAGGAPTASGASAQAQRLSAAQQRLDGAVQRMGTRMAEEIDPRLTLFLLDLTADIEQEFLLGTLEKAARGIAALTPDLGEAESAAREIEQIVEAAKPPEAPAPRGR